MTCFLMTEAGTDLLRHVQLVLPAGRVLGMGPLSSEDQSFVLVRSLDSTHSSACLDMLVGICPTLVTELGS